MGSCAAGEGLRACRELAVVHTIPARPPRAQSGIRYPVVVRFENQNYAGVSTNNYALDEVVEAK